MYGNVVLLSIIAVIDETEDAPYHIQRPKLFYRNEEDVEDSRRLAARFVERSRLSHDLDTFEATTARPWAERRKINMALSHQDAPIYRMRVKVLSYYFDKHKFPAN